VDTADRVREQWLALQEAAEVSELRERCERAVFEEQTVPFRWRAYFPQPFAIELADDGSHQLARLGVDAAGRPVIQCLREDLSRRPHRVRRSSVSSAIWRAVNETATTGTSVA
jgi:hypothetical protein